MMRSKYLIVSSLINSLPLLYWIIGLILLFVASLNNTYELPIFGDDYFDDHNVLFVSLFSFIAGIIALFGVVKTDDRKVKKLLYVILLLTILIPIIIGYSLNFLCNEHFYCGSMYTGI